MATHEPKNWRLPENLDIRNYAEAWANEILPIAREAHERLKFTNIHQEQEENRVVAAGEAGEKPEPDHIVYRKWAANVVREELHKAGWRLADLLEKILRSPSASAEHGYGYLVIFNMRASHRANIKTHGILIRDGKVMNVSGFGR